MSRIAAFVTEHSRQAWALALAFAVGGGLLAGLLVRDIREGERLSQLATEAERRGIEIMSQTLNGNVMGSLSLLGVIDEEIKHDAAATIPVNGKRISGLLEAVSRSHGADGVFIVGNDGVVRSSWDSSGKPSTGLNVRFRPYFQMALRGRDNVYAAVSLARGDRALYFSTPVRSATTRESEAIGAVVARSNLSRVDAVLKGKTDIALLLSPQGVVFAGSRGEWVGHLAGAPTPERLKAIRDLKQFGAMFDNREPAVLPMDITGGVQVFEGRRHALATANVQWNDPYGDWTLVLMEDLSRTVPLAEPAQAAAAVAAVLLLLSSLAVHLLRGHHAQLVSTRRIEEYAHAREASIERKARQAEAALRFQRAKSLKELAEAFLAETHRILGSLQGMVYVCGTDAVPTMHLAASYACADRIPQTLALGEGLLGQCALDRESRVLDTTAHHSWTIRSGLGDTRPAAVMIAPLLLNETSLGVVEIAVLDRPTPQSVEQFTEMAALLALNLEILRRHQTGTPPMAEATS